MASIAIARKHQLTHKKAKEVAEKIAQDLNDRFDLTYAWEGDHIAFERPGVHGTLHVAHDTLELNASLGFLLTPLKPAIEREIHAQLDKLLAARPTTTARTAKTAQAEKPPKAAKGARPAKPAKTPRG